MWRPFSRHWFLWALAACLGIGFTWPSTLAPFAHSGELRTGIIVVVMVLMGWTLDPKSIVGNIRRPLPSVLAILVNILVVPLLAWPALWVLPLELAGGLIVAWLVPCTLASATVWTRAAGGDDAVAMMTTVVTNVLCFVVAPLGIWLLLRQQAETDVGSQMSGLFFQVVAPLVGGQCLRLFGLAAWADHRKVPLATLAQVGILLMVLLGSVISAERMAANPSRAGSFWTIAATAALSWIIHLAAVGVGYYAAAAASLPRAQQLAIAISGGQKTLMAGLQLALGCGVSVMPMVLYHIGQLFIDTLLVRYWVTRLPARRGSE
ncbi:MAG: bile acid:sodium symporter family protein [Planctomycetaceae bacterium]